MRKFTRFNKSGAALLVVLATLLITTLLAIAVLRFMQSQGTLSRHAFNRIRAYYAAKGGLVFAYEMVREGVWVPNPAGGGNNYYCIRRATQACSGGTMTAEVIDPDIPFPVRITLGPWTAVPAPGTPQTQISCLVDYNLP